MIKFFGIFDPDQFWNKLIFQNRNKEYGAYELRNGYSSRMSRGILFSLIIFFLLLLTPLIYSWLESLISDVQDNKFETHEVNLSQTPVGNMGSKKIPLLSKSDKSIQDEDNSKKSETELVHPKIKKDVNTNTEKEKLNNSTKENEKNTSVTKSSDSQEGVTNGSTNSIGDSANSNQIYKLVRQMPVFAGCNETGGTYSEQKKCSDQRLLGYLKSNIRYPPLAIRNKTEGVVLVQFIIEKNGSVSNIKVIHEIGDGCGAETVRVLELLNTLKLKWSPGIQGETPVRVQYTLPVEFDGP
ncbi:MAG: energy transducer TonB [Saprospiraceae bacterium]